MWGNEIWFEVAVWWPAERAYGGWTRCETRPEAERLAGRMAAGGVPENVHIRQVSTKVIRGAKQ